MCYLETRYKTNIWLHWLGGWDQPPRGASGPECPWTAAGPRAGAALSRAWEWGRVVWRGPPGGRSCLKPPGCRRLWTVFSSIDLERKYPGCHTLGTTSIFMRHTGLRHLTQQGLRWATWSPFPPLHLQSVPWRRLPSLHTPHIQSLPKLCRCALLNIFPICPLFSNPCHQCPWFLSIVHPR